MSALRILGNLPLLSSLPLYVRLRGKGALSIQLPFLQVGTVVVPKYFQAQLDNRQDVSKTPTKRSQNFLALHGKTELLQPLLLLRAFG
jgi:hypothetical protein